MYFCCSVFPHVVGIYDYGWPAWWGMAGIWGGLFIWPMIFLPFAFFALYRPFRTLVRCIVGSFNFQQQFSYAIPLIAATILAAGTWAIEVYDPREVPWTIDIALPKPGCQRGPELPSAIARLSDKELQNWLRQSSIGNAPLSIPNLSPDEQRRWWALINLSSYDFSLLKQNNPPFLAEK
jgi:hypothetical protein